MKRLGWLLAAGALMGVAVAPATVLAQESESGFRGFLHRAGSAVTQTAQAVVGKPATAGSNNSAGATTAGDYYRPISPAHGSFPGIFGNYRPGVDTFPRVALTFTRFGASEPCWTVRASIWRSEKSPTIETFQICNSPIIQMDDLGNPSTVDVGQGMTLANAILPAQNVEGSSHAASSSTRNAGPNPPLRLFQIEATGPNAYAFSIQYRSILLRLAWLSGYVNPSAPTINSTIGKSMWTVFDPNGNLDRAAHL